jgi:hypothetical protein
MKFEKQLRLRPRAASVVVKIDYLDQTGDRTVVHEMRLLRDAAEAGRFERVAVGGAFADGEASHIQIFLLAGQKSQGVKLVVGKVGAVVAFAARGFADEENQAALLLIGEGTLVSGGVAVMSPASPECARKRQWLAGSLPC